MPDTPYVLAILPARGGSKGLPRKNVRPIAGKPLIAYSIEAAKASPIFEGRVAHGYLILSFAAGLFVWPDPGPVLANTGLENLRFLTPLYPGDSLRVELTVRAKSIKSEETGQVRWAVEVFNQKDELVATYDLLTENVP